MKKQSARSMENTAGVAITIRVTPRAQKNEVAEIMVDGTVKIRLTAPPVEGKANAALVKFLADTLHLPPGSIEIVAGESGRNKIVALTGIDAATANQRILDARVKHV